MTGEEPSTRQLLLDVHLGDQRAMSELLERHLPFIKEQVRKRLGAVIRWKAETDDIVHDVVASYLKYGPRYLVKDAEHLRALLARMVENVLHDEHDRWRGLRRDVLRERPLPADSVADLDRPLHPVSSPSQQAVRAETREWVLLALELLATDDRRILQLRALEEQSFPAAAALLGISEDAARMRFNRALARLIEVVTQLKGGQVAALLRTLSD